MMASLARVAGLPRQARGNKIMRFGSFLGVLDLEGNGAWDMITVN